MVSIKRDENRVVAMSGETNDANRTPTAIQIDPTTGRVLVDISVVAAAGSTTQVQYNDGGNLAGASGLVYDKTNIRAGVNVASPAFTLDVGGKIGINSVQVLYEPTGAALYNLIVGNGGNSITNIGADTGYANTMVGVDTGLNITSGNDNTAVGMRALYQLTTGYYNMAFGYYALGNATTGYNNVAYGPNALHDTVSSNDNVAIGGGALYANTTGVLNTAVGNAALYYKTAGNYNCALGYWAGQGANPSSFSNGIYIGYQAGNALVSGSNNILIGHQAGANLTTGGTNILIGFQINASAAGVSNELNIGGALKGSMTGMVLTLPSVTDTLVGKATTDTLTNKTLDTPLFQGAWDGWIGANETWTYASASTFTVSGDVTGKYQAGDYIKWTQTTVKYGVIVAVSYGAPNTTITIAVNTDYVLTNAVISANYFSHNTNPKGFPFWFTFALTWAGFSVSPGSTVSKYCIIGHQCHVIYQISGNGTSNSTSTSCSGFPVTPLTAQVRFPLGIYADNGAVGANPSYGTFSGTGLVFSAGNTSSDTTWTNSGVKNIYSFNVLFDW